MISISNMKMSMPSNVRPTVVHITTNVFAIKMKTIENVINFIGQRLGLRFASKLWNVIIIFVSIVWQMMLNDLTQTLATTSRRLK